MTAARRRTNTTGRDFRVLDRRANAIRQAADAVRRDRLKARDIKQDIREEVVEEAARKPMRRPEPPKRRDKKDLDVLRPSPGRSR